MVRFIVGLVFGVAFCGTVLWALAVLNPLERTGQSAPPVQVEQRDEAAAQGQPEPVPEPEPAPEAAPETIDVPATGSSDDQQGAAPQPSGEQATQTTDAAPEMAPSDPVDAGAAAEDASQAVAQVPTPAAPQVGGETAPMVGESGPAAFTGGPDIGGGIELSAPAIGGGEGANVGTSAGDRPIRTAAAPQQVTAGSTDTGATPAVDTESTGTPEIGGSELEKDETPTGPAPELQAGTAMADNAAVFSGDRGRPLMSIILIDNGEFPDLRPGLTGLTAPITFGVNAAISDPQKVARDYRGAGFEIAAVLPGSGRLGLVADLPEEEVAPMLARVLDRVPVAATVIDPIGGPLAKDRGIANAVLDALAVTGHGLLTHRGNGLNNVPIIAGEKGVPSELVYRVIDAEPGAANISLELERAVLDASRSGHVIVVGRVRQETVTTLFSWLLGSGAREVTIAPASAVLRDSAS